MKHYLKIYKLVLLLLITTSSVCTFGQAGETLLKKVQDNFNKIRTLEAEFKQTITDSTSARVTNLSGKFFYAKGGKFKIDLSQRAIISDGKTIWNVDNNLKRVVISDNTDKNQSFTLETFIYDLPEKCKVTQIAGNSGESELLLTPEINLGFKTAKITIGKTNLISSVSVTDYNGNNIQYKFSNTKTNPEFTGNPFSFTVLEGFEVIDLR